MKPNTSWQISLCLLALVAVSAGTGILVGRRWARADMARQDNPETWNAAAMRTFERTVRPTPEQRPRIEAALDTAVDQLTRIRADALARSSNVIWQLVATVEQELTPEQRQSFQAMKPQQQDLSSLDVLQVTPTAPPRPPPAP